MFGEHQILESFIGRMRQLFEDVFDDVESLRQRPQFDVVVPLAKLLFYVQMHRGSVGNTDLKRFFSDESLEDKLDQFDRTIANHQVEFEKTLDYVRQKIKAGKKYEVYGQITGFFERREKIFAH